MLSVLNTDAVLNAPALKFMKLPNDASRLEGCVLPASDIPAAPPHNTPLTAPLAVDATEPGTTLDATSDAPAARPSTSGAN